MSDKTKATLEMLLCAALWSIAGIFMKLLPWNGFAVASLRSLIAGLTIAAYMLLRRIRPSVTPRTLKAGVMTGCVYLCFACANKLTTAANAIVLQFVAPVFIVVFSALFLKQRIRRADLAVVLFTLLGIALFFFDSLAPGYVLGNLVAIASGMFMAGMFMMVGEIRGEERFSAILIGQCFTFLVGLPFVFLTKPVFTGTAVISILVLGVFQLGVSYILYAKAAENCPPLACSLLSALEPLLNPVWVFLFDGERPGLFALVGAVIVICSITVWTVFGQKKEETETV
ncbi:MAG: EamA family transporter [Oscillospiraceae bacterium]|nr:EamA family transporter [Oscillospiraceae bacterium]